MKKIVIALLTLALCLSCATTSGDSKSVLLLVPSAEGSYFSAAVLGVKALEEKYPGTKTKVVEMRCKGIVFFPMLQIYNVFFW